MSGYNRSINLLVIEDSETDALLLKEALADIPEFKCEVDYRLRLEDGLSRVRENHVDATLLDLGLPDSRGLETFLKYQTVAPQVPVLVLTALRDESTGIEAVKRGAQDYLIKGHFPAAMLVRSIRYAIERQRVNSELRNSQHQFRQLATRLQEIREEERTNMAREVHDEVGQLLTGLKMDLSWIKQRLGAAEDPAALTVLHRRAEQAGRLIDRCIESVQNIALQLRPSALDHLGLAEAIRDEARRFGVRSEVKIQLELADHINDVSPAAATAVFRIFQEIITNVARHARASVVHVRWSQRGAYSELEVQDDGIGIAPEEMNAKTSLGLLGMSERAVAVGGSLHVAGIPGKGTRVAVQIPTNAREKKYVEHSDCR
ncbi:response regulator [bacterium]|nr:response regulator [bacterium]